MTDGRRRPRLPTHIGIMLGVSTAAYSVALAGVAASQARDEAATAAAQAPTLSALDHIVATNDDLSNRLGRSGSDYSALAKAYVDAGGRLADLEAALANLSGAVVEINGVSQALPATIPLPALSRAVGGSVPATHSTTGASGVP
jgi:hypothetical protein